MITITGIVSNIYKMNDSVPYARDNGVEAQSRKLSLKQGIVNIL